MGVSRPTARLWVKRAREQGLAHLKEASRRPRRLRAETPCAVQEQLLALKAAHPAWGAKKLHAVLWPAPTLAPICVRTVDRLLARHHLVRPRLAARPLPAWQRFEKESCNQLWQLDYKGIEKGCRYYPLSVIDDHSRFCLAFSALERRDTETVWSLLWQLFGEYGLPDCILCDNGDGFNSLASQGPTLFQARLWRLGIRTTHGRPAHPQTQGKVERFHRTLEEEWASELRQPSAAQANLVWVELRTCYNWQRPHEALGQRVPGVVYEKSARLRPATLPAAQLSGVAPVRKVDSSGKLSYNNRTYRAGRGLSGEWVEIQVEERGEQRQEVLYYSGVRIAPLNRLQA